MANGGSSLSGILDFVRAEQNVRDGDPDFGPDANLLELGYLDSFSIVKLILHVKDSFGIDIEKLDFHALNYRTARQIASYIDARRAR